MRSPKQFYHELLFLVDFSSTSGDSSRLSDFLPTPRMAARTSYSPSEAFPITPSKSRRLSSFHIKTPGGQTPANQIFATKTQSRRRRSFASKPRPSPPSASPTNTRCIERSVHQPVLSKEEIAHMYSSTIKLCQDNKINTKNTWNLNLIDYMAMLVKNNDSGQVSRTVEFEDEPSSITNSSEDTNFQLAGVTLDAGVKIYCSRVDSVHSNAYKVLGGLSRTGNDGSPDAEDGTFEDDSNGDAENSSSRRQKKRTGRATLENNMSNITSKTLETDLAVDPLFQKLSAAFDEGGAKGMLLNNLPVGPDGQILFDSGESADTLILKNTDDLEQESSPNGATYDVSTFLPLDPPSVDDKICKRFLRFYHSRSTQIEGSQADRDSEKFQNKEQHVGSNMNHDFGATGFEYDHGDLQSAGEELGMFTEDMPEDEPPQDDDDVNIHVTDSTHNRFSVGSSSSLMASQRGGLDLIEAGVSLQGNAEYAFFDASALSGWAGPQHWRFRPVESSQSSSLRGRKYGKKAKRPRGKTAMLLDFSSDAPEVDFATAFAPPKNPTDTQLSEAVRTGFSEKKVTLPEDLHYTPKFLVSLFLRPGTVVKINNGAAACGEGNHDRNEDDASNWYDFDNDCDTNNFCPADGQFYEGNQDNNQNVNDNSEVNGMELVPEPTRVEKIDIDYAKVAKKVDVRQLKSGMWSKLCGVPSGSANNAETDRNGQDESASRDVDKTDSSENIDIRKGDTHRLQTIVKDVSSFVPDTSLPDVSFQYIFICLLHLANEKTLKVEPSQDSPLKDLIITSEIEDSSE